MPSRTLFGWLTKYSSKVVYPPAPGDITTSNRLFPAYIDNQAELSALILDKDPLLLNFTYPGDPRCNKVTLAIFAVLADKSKYPLSKRVSLANIACDLQGGRELQSLYTVGSLPSVVVLKRQLIADRWVPDGRDLPEAEFIKYLKSAPL